MSKKRVLCTIAGQEMVDSSDTEDDDISDSEILNANKKQRVEVNEDEEEVDSEEESKKNRGESSISNDPQAATNLKKVHKIKISKKDATKVVLKGGERKKKESATYFVADLLPVTYNIYFFWFKKISSIIYIYID